MAVPTGDSLESPRLTSAQRVLSILGVFDTENLSLSLSEISRRTGLTLSTTHRLVNELRCWGALSRSGDGKYSIGLRILELGTLTPQGGQLREIALPYLHDLQHATRANIHLGVPQGHDIVYIESLRARDTVPVPSRLGGRWPMHATGTGLVLLAHSSQEFQEEVLASKLRRYTENTLTDPDALRHFLAEVRKAGVAVVESQLTRDVMAVAVPIRGPRDHVVAAVGITVPSGSVSPRSLVPALSASARSISRALGAPSAAAGGPPRRPAHWQVREVKYSTSVAQREPGLVGG
ncbi:IclR family transcriptional regulator [Acrocarpospora phusangensis]|uniref:IclR family transcriptional regulator n=1 Tax=Acrocarpospora phusangensis TaxID=1070424 RepID=A0A919QAW8_9ACTN|nr:IclR family transcriptional regulator [Acrocarpospora phusangensis]GIH23985.1 IclR family transcriptional regulator [Acrocarpospora phusangensis]